MVHVVTGGSFMTVVPAVNEYVNSYTFTVPRAYGGLNFNVAITVPAMYKDGLVFDGVPFKSKTGLVKALPVPSPFENFIVLTYRISGGYHHIYHSRPLTTFGVLVHSASFQQGYGFYAGYNTNGSCRTSSLSSATINNATSKGQICYNCEDLGHVFLCDTVNICSANEVCSVIQYIVSGQMKYRTGCQKLEACQNKQLASLSPNTTCFECCHDDYCNNKGCGEDDVPDRQSRGPICYDCQYVSRTDECTRVSPCETTQTCRFEEYSWFGQSQFKMGCAEKLTCGMSSSSGRQVSKRASPLCHRCCSENYCNSNCAATHSSVIVG